MTAGSNPSRWRPRLAETLGLIAAAAPAFTDEWWIIGSAAAALAGADIAEVRDVDLLLSERDATALLARWAGAPKAPPDPSDQFRSAVFARFQHLPLAVEAFGGFEMRVRGRWRRVEPMTRLRCGGVFTPSTAEQIALLEAMGREKDGARIAALRARL
ncbi:MAG: hypothetical protein AAB227_12640 [Pseudomonadota bacterium]